MIWQVIMMIPGIFPDLRAFSQAHFFFFPPREYLPWCSSWKGLLSLLKHQRHHLIKASCKGIVFSPAQTSPSLMPSPNPFLPGILNRCHPVGQHSDWLVRGAWVSSWGRKPWLTSDVCPAAGSGGLQQSLIDFTGPCGRALRWVPAVWS